MLDDDLEMFKKYKNTIWELEYIHDKMCFGNVKIPKYTVETMIPNLSQVLERETKLPPDIINIILSFCFSKTNYFLY